MPLALVAGASVLAGLVGCGEGGSRENGGPVQLGEANKLAISAPVGKKFMFGLPVVTNTGDEPAQMEGVRLVDASSGLRVVDSYLAGPKRQAEAVASSRQWPIEEMRDLTMLDGAKLAPDSSSAGRRGGELVFVLQVSTPGRYVMRGAELDYKVGDKTYRRAVPSALSVCAADVPEAQLAKRECPFPPEPEGEL